MTDTDARTKNNLVISESPPEQLNSGADFAIDREHSECLPQERSWFERNKKLVVGAYLGTAALTLSELGPIKDQIAESAHWTVPAIALTETFATAGLAGMAVSAGEKIGNPLSLRKRLNELKLRDRLHSSSLFRKGAYLNLAGAAGTSSVIAVETISSFPVNAWPAALGIAGLSTALSLPFYRIARGGRAVEGGQK